MDRSPNEESLHRQLILQAAAWHKARGCKDITIDLPGDTKPAIIEGVKGSYRPDLTCIQPGSPPALILLEAETCRSIFHRHTLNQWTLFADYARKTSAEFHIVVPPTCDVDGRVEAGSELVLRRLRQIDLSPSTVSIWTPL
jgi:hypothetical protein